MRYTSTGANARVNAISLAQLLVASRTSKTDTAKIRTDFVNPNDTPPSYHAR